MKQTILFSLLVGLAGPVAAQHTEYSGRAGLGLFWFGGHGAEAVSSVSYYADNLGTGPNGSISNPYGRKVGTGFTLGGRMQHVSQGNGLTTLDIGYDRMRSRAAVKQVDYSPSPYSSAYIGTYTADGTTNLVTQNLTVFLGAGHRFQVGAVNLDLLAGPEAAYVFGMKNKGSGSFDYNNGTPWKVNQESYKENRGDFRLHAEITAWYQRVGITAGYAHGLVSYRGGQYGNNESVYSRTLRLGMIYRVQ
ncbi:hypothetical protein [Hymenobacter sp.]|jgi:hypothetical protein|uniref:hypothetical protein n=1 Tax=Hymenobacter sp. TaxID=1898978 RepID=UPI002EDB71F7